MCIVRGSSYPPHNLHRILVIRGYCMFREDRARQPCFLAGNTVLLHILALRPRLRQDNICQLGREWRSYQHKTSEGKHIDIPLNRRDSLPQLRVLQHLSKNQLGTTILSHFNLRHSKILADKFSQNLWLSLGASQHCSKSCKHTSIAIRSSIYNNLVVISESSSNA